MIASGPTGDMASRFEDGLRFLATALALQADHRNQAAATSSACDAVKCFMKILEQAAKRRLPDPSGEVERLRNQCIALMTTAQNGNDAAKHAVEAAILVRDQAARLLPKLMASPE